MAKKEICIAIYIHRDEMEIIGASFSVEGAKDIIKDDMQRRKIEFERDKKMHFDPSKRGSVLLDHLYESYEEWISSRDWYIQKTVFFEQ